MKPKIYQRIVVVYYQQRRFAIQLVTSSMLYIFAMVSCGDGGWFLQNDKGPFVPAALNLQACNLLAKKEFSVLSQKERSAYAGAVRSGDIILLNNGTNIEQGDALNFENGYLTPYTNTGPITASEEVRRHIGVYMWVLLKDGPNKGKEVCVSVSMRKGKYPPL